MRESEHQPREVVAVREDHVQALLATGKFKEISSDSITPKKADDEEIFFSNSMTEKEIKKLIEKHGIDIDYDIKRDTKKETLLKLKGLNYRTE